MELPWPFNNRCIYMSVLATEVPNENGIVLVMRTTDEEDREHDIISNINPDECVEAEVHYCCIYID